jgi:hypothetical protein
MMRLNCGFDNFSLAAIGVGLANVEIAAYSDATMQLKCHAPRAPRRMKRGLGSAVPQEEGTMRPSWAGSEVVESVVP